MKKSDIKLKMDLEIANAVMCLSRKQYDEAKKSMVVALDMINKMTQIADGDEKRYLQAYSFNLEREIKYLEDKISAMATQNKGEKQSRATTVQNTVPVDVSLGISPQYLQYTFSDVAGLDDVKQIVKDKVINPYYYPGLYQMFKKKLGGGILLYGLPGTGKTMVAQAIAKETNAKFFEIKTSDVLSKWLGESCRNVREVFEQANRCSNAVVFFDEIDALTSERDDAGNEAISRVVCELLAQMDGVKKKSPQQRLLVIGATNRPWKIDSAFLRPGRFDEQIYVPLPDNEARKTIIQNSIAYLPGYANIDTDALVDKTSNFSGADVNYLCEKAKEIAIRRIISSQMKGRELLPDDFNLALNCVKSTVLLSDVCKIELWQKERQLHKPSVGDDVCEQH